VAPSVSEAFGQQLVLMNLERSCLKCAWLAHDVPSSRATIKIYNNDASAVALSHITTRVQCKTDVSADSLFDTGTTDST
jgi:hypothetical protein